MTKLFPVIILAILIVGCGSRGQQTSATKVQNPTDAAQPSTSAQTPATPSTPAPAIKSKSKDGWVTTTTGLKYKDTKVGKGKEVVSNMRVTVNYKGWLDNGTVFDTSKQPGRTPFSFTVDNDAVIQGWHEGLKGMKVGGTRELTIPPALAYASQGKDVIPPNATIHFKIELLDATK